MDTGEAAKLGKQLENSSGVWTTSNTKGKQLGEYHDNHFRVGPGERDLLGNYQWYPAAQINPKAPGSEEKTREVEVRPVKPPRRQQLLREATLEQSAPPNMPPKAKPEH